MNFIYLYNQVTFKVTWQEKNETDQSYHNDTLEILFFNILKRNPRFISHIGSHFSNQGVSPRPIHQKIPTRDDKETLFASCQHDIGSSQVFQKTKIIGPHKRADDNIFFISYDKRSN